MHLLSLIGSIVPAALLFGAPISAQPDACKLITLADVTAAVGRGFTKGTMVELASAGPTSSCLYRRDPKTTVAISILPGPNRNAKAAVLGRRQRYETAGHPVAPLAGLCDAAFSVVIAPSDAIVVAAKGQWQMDVQVLISGRPNLQAAQTLTKAACRRRP
jgi:hypothetical protein